MLEGNSPNCSRLPHRYAISSPFFAAYFIISSAVLTDLFFDATNFSSHHNICDTVSQKGELIGSLNARRIEVHPFTPALIKLLETFADQAVIAIENVRLFNELKESLGQQTATSEILGVIASSPTDIQPVLDVVAEN